jgi:hypothetical protein
MIELFHFVKNRLLKRRFLSVNILKSIYLIKMDTGISEVCSILTVYFNKLIIKLLHKVVNKVGESGKKWEKIIYFYILPTNSGKI